jgi:superfamily I DNA/RNA helicase
MEMEEGISPRWIAEHAHQAVENAKKQSATIDFADMIYLPLALGIIRPWFSLVVVDEAQDMTASQLELAMRACKKTGRIAIVGDDRQAIYAFRGADSGSIDRLKSSLRATELGLCTTYRCPKRVVAIAQEIVTDFIAADSAPEGLIESCNTARMIATLTPRDFVLSRTNAPLVRVCLALLRSGRKAVIRGRDIGKGIVALVNRQKARDLISLSKKLNNWRERETKRAQETLKQGAAEERIAYLNDSIGVIEALAEDVRTVNELTSKLTTLFTDDNGDSIICSTTHKAKGLESRNVYLLEGTFRGKRASEPEERNILYVAVTRSKERLVWVSGYEK